MTKEEGPHEFMWVFTVTTEKQYHIVVRTALRKTWNLHGTVLGR